MNSDNCLICYSLTKTRRLDIQPYVCDCKYYIHKKCYNRWKMTGTQRVCVICNAIDIDNEDVIEEIDTQYFGIVIIHPMAFQHHFCCVHFVSIAFILYILLLCGLLFRIAVTELKINT